jgi:hypothetical protein
MRACTARQGVKPCAAANEVSAMAVSRAQQSHSKRMIFGGFKTFVEV